jgi:predicted membrane channel-forming protein YqfA (hemolysin III family)
MVVSVTGCKSTLSAVLSSATCHLLMHQRDCKVKRVVRKMDHGSFA